MNFVTPHRKHLVEALAEAAFQLPLTAVVAPMGYGKTAAAVALTESMGIGAVYFDVPQEHCRDRPIWDLLCAILAEKFPAIAVEPHRGAAPKTSGQFRRAVDGILAVTNQVVLILDNYQHINEPDVDAFFMALAETAPDGVHVVLFSRPCADAFYFELAKNGRASLFEETSLRFSESETREYLDFLNIPDVEAIEKIWAFSDGWPIVTAAAAKEWRERGELPQSSDIEALLAESVLSRHSGAERSLLARLSILDSFSENDMDSLLGKAKAKDLRDRGLGVNAFVRDAETGRFRFHRIVREQLGRELLAERDVDISELCRLAGESCMDNGELYAAFRFFLRAGKDGDLERALGIFIVAGAETLLLRHYEEIQAAVQAMPWKIREKQPLGYLAFVRLCLATRGLTKESAWRHPEIDARFSRSRHIPSDLLPRIKGELALIEGLLASDDMDSLWKKYDEARSLLQGPSLIHPWHLAWNFGCPHLSFGNLSKMGTFESLTKKAASAAGTLGILTDGHFDGFDAVSRAEYHLERGNLDEAARSLDKIDADNGGRIPAAMAISARFCRARLLLTEKRSEEALDALASLRPQIAALGRFELAECLDLAVGYVGACLGRHDLIADWIVRGGIFSPPHGLARKMPFVFTVYGKTLLAAGKIKRLDMFAGFMRDRFDLHENLPGRIHAKVFEAICSHRLRGAKDALEAVRAAVDLSRADGLVFLLAEYGRLVLPLLRGLKNDREHDPHLERLVSLTERLRLGHTGRERAHGNILTLREQEVMRMIARGMSNAAIALELGITESAVRKMLMLVYAKLGASNRIQASHLFDLLAK